MRLWKILTLALLALPAWAAAEPVGKAVRISGEARADGVALAPGSPFEPGAELTTGDNARLEVVFTDGTNLILGERARLTVERYVYDAAASSGEARLRASGGAFLVTSGAVAKLPGRPLSVATPVAIIGVRGTRFWGGPLDNALDVLVLDGAVTVTNGTGRTDLESGQGTGVTAADRAPGAAITWADAKVRRALDSVEFR
jgi:hypothetical protein